MKVRIVFPLSVSVFLFVFMFCLTAHAEWSEPVMLSELNDFNGNLVVPGKPFASGDEHFIYYIMPSVISPYTLYEARLNEVTGFYENKRIVEEVMTAQVPIFECWASEHATRIYCSKDRKEPSSLWGRAILLAERSDPDSNFTQVRFLEELHINRYESAPTLTADELEIMWAGTQVRNGPWVLYRARRASVAEPFGEIQEASEMNAIGASGLMLSPDGLMISFTLPGSGGPPEMWMGRRESRAEPFGDFYPMDVINQWGVATGSASFSGDQKTLYFFQRQGEPTDLTKMGLFVSTWVNPYETAVAQLLEAAEMKRQAEALLTEASALERAALQSLQEAIEDEIPDPLSPRQIRRCRLEIVRSLIQEFQANRFIRQSIQYLETVLEKLAPADVEPAEAAGCASGMISGG